MGSFAPGAAVDHGWRAPDLRWRYAGCNWRVSVTAGTIFDKTRTPLTVWFAVAKNPRLRPKRLVALIPLTRRHPAR